jgi:hypothetical protein
LTQVTPPTQPIGSVPRPLGLIQAIGVHDDGTDAELELELEPLYEAAIRDTIECFEATGSLVITTCAMPISISIWLFAMPMFQSNRRSSPHPH